jgi:hypothetical protein
MLAPPLALSRYRRVTVRRSRRLALREGVIVKGDSDPQKFSRIPFLLGDENGKTGQI